MRTEPTNLRLNSDAKAAAYAVFEQLGIKPAQAFNLFLNQVSLHGGLPFPVKVPNAETRAAMEELENGGGTKYNSAQDLFDDFGI